MQVSPAFALFNHYHYGKPIKNDQTCHFVHMTDEIGRRSFQQIILRIVIELARVFTHPKL